MNASSTSAGKVLFLCTGNSCRSQMAEGFARAMHPQFTVRSAGVMKTRLAPRAVTAMAEVGVDISAQFSKTIDELDIREFDLVITLCSHAREACPFFPGAPRVLHRGFDDPPSLAAQSSPPDIALAPYRRVRDEIREFIGTLAALITAR
ncbi:arsenate reductase [Desulfobaculum xiamenense]|uniref:Arsenate reductase n=1 Tax=Desulfobaculum xiamenense TaxID=995050 RepID=A0A846QG89_9BACT|nr:arsenate reductase ArsC [Desulfobaculum xiamenense]NJB67816.1 arsenate reductase [Desulfobaculum xiamenense]